jgi:hypothetical protein
LEIAHLIIERFGIAIARTTINRLRHLARFDFLPPTWCQIVIERQRRQRTEFAHDFLRGKLPLQNLFFCDEFRFCMGPENYWIWRRRGEYEEGICAETDKFSKISIHVWGAIGVGFKSSLIIFEQNVNSAIEADALLKSGFVGLVNGTFGERHWHLGQSGASCHTST